MQHHEDGHRERTETAGRYWINLRHGAAAAAALVVGASALCAAPAAAAAHVHPDSARHPRRPAGVPSGIPPHSAALPPSHAGSATPSSASAATKPTTSKNTVHAATKAGTPVTGKADTPPATGKPIAPVTGKPIAPVTGKAIAPTTGNAAAITTAEPSALPATEAPAATAPAATRRAVRENRMMRRPAPQTDKDAAGGEPSPRAKATARLPKGHAHPEHARAAEPPCLHLPIELERGFAAVETARISLTQCDGAISQQGREALSVLARPMSAPRPRSLSFAAFVVGGRGSKETSAEHAVDADSAGAKRRTPRSREWAPGVKLVDPGLVARLQRVVDHFHAHSVTIVSGYRPSSVGSFHQSARALDFHLPGVKNEALVAFCRTFADTGCGYYPNSSFVHMDVRPTGTGHVFWIDASGPGEPAHYVSRWPPPPDPRAPNTAPLPPEAAWPMNEPTARGGVGVAGDALVIELAAPRLDASPKNQELAPAPTGLLEL